MRPVRAGRHRGRSIGHSPVPDGGIEMSERNHAVVVGGGMAGLLAARVLSESFTRVTVVERDVLTAGAEPRRGVPQGRHVHGYQARGVEILDELFPGLLAEAADEGAALVADLSRCHFSPGGGSSPRRIARTIATYSRISATGLSIVWPYQPSTTGRCETPMPRFSRPPE